MGIVFTLLQNEIFEINFIYTQVNFNLLLITLI